MIVDLVLVVGTMAFFSVLDIRKMSREGLKREILVYFLLCLAALVIAFIYLPDIGRRSLISYVLEMLGVRG